MPAAKPGSKDKSSVQESSDKNGLTKGETQAVKNDEAAKPASAPEKRSTTAGAERMGSLRDKFEKGDIASKKGKKKAAPKIKFAGVESAKTKFIEEATKLANGTVDGPRGPKEITPPPEGSYSGVLESQPKERAPGVVSSSDMFEPEDLKAIGATTKNLKEKFKQLESGAKVNGDEKEGPSSLVEAESTVAADATKLARSRWKDLESGKSNVEQPTERPKIDVRGEGYGGVFENEPERIEGIVRGTDRSNDELLKINARERREEFLRRAAEEAQISKESSKPLDINAAESGIYENEPARRDDVARYDDDNEDEYTSGGAKWASEAKMRFMQEASKTQDVQRTQPVVVAEGAEVEGKDAAAACYATHAKQAFLQRQKQAEDAAKNKARPDIINIWSEPCTHSGVFENTPKARKADVIAGSESEGENEEGGEDEGEEEE